MARFAIDTAHDKSAEVWIASFLSLIYSILTLGARVYLKGWLAGTFGPDDASILIAQVLALGQFVTTMYGVHEGLAKDLSLLDKSRKDHIAKAFEASQVLYVLALALSKVSVAFLIERIFSQLNYKRSGILCKATMAVMAAWGIASALAVSVDCASEQILPEHAAAICPASTSRWLGIVIVDCLTELWLVILPVYFLSSVQMGTESKVTAAAAFAFRLGSIPFAVLHYVSYADAIDSNIKGTSVSSVVSWQQASLYYSLLAATVPLSRTLLKRFKTGNLILNPTGTYSANGMSGSGSGSRYVKTQPFDSLKSDTGKSRAKQDDRRFWPDRATYSTAVYHEDAARHERVGSQDMIIWREDAITINHE